MKNIVLFDSPEVSLSLLPLTFTRPAAMMRCGILRISEKWEKIMDAKPSMLTSELLSEKFPAVIDEKDNLFIAGWMLPDADTVKKVKDLALGCALFDEDGHIVAYRGTLEEFRKGAKEGDVVKARFLKAPQDVFTLNGEEICADFNLITKGRSSAPLPENCTLLGDKSQLFIEEGAELLCSVINVTGGPVYIGRDAEVMEMSCVRGPLALCEHAVIKMGSKVYEDTTIGPWCKVGGEISNAVFFGYSNKAHDGYLGNAVIGEWCNLGAGCVSSNLKNDYSLIRLWNYAAQSFVRTKMQFCGLIMGDHSKAGIQTMFNTATVVGIGCNIHGSGFPRTYIPSFSFGGAAGFDRQRFDKFITTARTVMARRHIELTAADEHILATLYAQSE